MRRDSIFYKLFQQSPTLLFELLSNPPNNADSYRFDSVAVKEPKFEIDGVFLPPESDGAGVVPSRSIEQSDIQPHRSLLNGEQIHRVYLDELGDIRQLPIWVALMVLTTVDEEQAPEEARYLLTRTTQEVLLPSSRAIIELITTIMVYRFEQLTQAEVESMLGITLKETRVYREIKEEGKQQLILFSGN